VPSLPPAGFVSSRWVAPEARFSWQEGALLAVSAALAGLGHKRVQQAMPPVPRQTQASVETDVEEIKERVQR